MTIPRFFLTGVLSWIEIVLFTCNLPAVFLSVSRKPCAYIKRASLIEQTPSVLPSNNLVMICTPNALISKRVCPVELIVCPSQLLNIKKDWSSSINLLSYAPVKVNHWGHPLGRLPAPSLILLYHTHPSSKIRE